MKMKMMKTMMMKIIQMMIIFNLYLYRYQTGVVQKYSVNFFRLPKHPNKL